MMFGVRMFEQQRPSPSENERATKAPTTTARQTINISTVRPAEDVVIPHPPPHSETVVDQPCDLRKRTSGRSSAMKERPRFGRTYTCDDCGFVFSCEKLLIEHILTCTNRKAFQTPKVSKEVYSDNGKAESSTSEGTDEQRTLCKGEDEWSDHKPDMETVIRSVASGMESENAFSRNITIKVERDDDSETDLETIKVVKVGNLNLGSCKVRTRAFKDNLADQIKFDSEEDPGVSAMDALEGKSTELDTDLKVHRIKEEKQDGTCIPCELCGALLTEEEQSAHYISNHMGHICACGRCGQVLIKGRQLQEHAERCGEPQGTEMDSPGEDSLLLEDAEAMEENLLEGADLGFRCPLCGLIFESESLAVEHTLACPEQEPFRPVMLEDGGEPDHRRKHFCAICGKGFYQRCHLREHYTVHTKEKQFTCQTCGKQFLRERQLRLHTDMHKGMARYVCPVCDQGTFLKHDHVRHMISHLSAGETICQVCFQIFPSGEHLEKHMDVHLYICGVCGEKFRLRKDMRSHYNSKHTKRQ